MATAAGVDSSAAELMLDLSAARHTWLARNAVLLLLKSGQMVIAHLTIQAGMVTHIKVSPDQQCDLWPAFTEATGLMQYTRI